MVKDGRLPTSREQNFLLVDSILVSCSCTNHEQLLRLKIRNPRTGNKFSCSCEGWASHARGTTTSSFFNTNQKTREQGMKSIARWNQYRLLLVGNPRAGSPNDYQGRFFRKNCEKYRKRGHKWHIIFQGELRY